MDRERLQLFGDNLKAFLNSKLSREILVFAFFFIVSAGFWLLQTLHEDYEMEVQIPMSLEDVPMGTVITQELPSEITVKVKDRGSTLLRYYQWRQLPGIEIDFNGHEHRASFGHVVLTHAEIQKAVSQRLQLSTRIVSVHPDTLDYYYTRGMQKRLPVVFRGHVGTSSLHYLESLTVTPDSVTVWGSNELLDSMTSVPTEVTTISGLAENMEQKVALAPIRGAKVEPAEVLLKAEVDIYTEKEVRVPIVGTNFPGGYSLRTFPSSALVSFRVGTKKYSQITSDNFVLTATFEELMALPDSMLTLQLRSIPEGASQVKISPERVQFLIEQTDTE